MIIHSSAGMAIVTAAYLLAQSVIHPGAENHAAETADMTRSMSLESASIEPATGETEKKLNRKKVIVIGKNSVSVKYVTK